jgi:hypothetical protein
MDSTGRLGPVFDLLERFVSEGQVNGAAVAVSYRGELVGEASQRSTRRRR